jgi:putative pre-16S rRNA nuclease
MTATTRRREANGGEVGIPPKGDDSEATEGERSVEWTRGSGEHGPERPGATHQERAMGVDLGSKRIGLALSDPTRVVASPHEVLQRGPDHPADHAAIIRVARDTGATIIVVGLPLSLSGAIGPAAEATLVEIDELRAVAEPAGIEVVAYDERLTTVTAERALDEARMRREARRRIVDKVAAAVMLQSWLDGEHG